MRKIPLTNLVSRRWALGVNASKRYLYAQRCGRCPPESMHTKQAAAAGYGFRRSKCSGTYAASPAPWLLLFFLQVLLHPVQDLAEAADAVGGLSFLAQAVVLAVEHTQLALHAGAGIVTQQLVGGTGALLRLAHEGDDPTPIGFAARGRWLTPSF